MNPAEISKLIDSYIGKRERSIAIVDFGNVEKWNISTGWKVDIKNLGNLIKHFSLGKQSLRRFYYGSDFGPDNKSASMVEFSRAILEKAQWSNFHIETKRVKYIKDRGQGCLIAKCDLDVEMTVDLIEHQNDYDHIVLFSGDGDLMRAIRYLKDTYGKTCIVMGARDHVAAEIFDAKKDGYVDEILFVEDFERRLSAQSYHRNR